MQNKVENNLEAIDLLKLQQNYYDAADRNSSEANKSITHLQTGLLTFVLAELAFIGTADLSKEHPSLLGIIAGAILVLSAISFLLGTRAQWYHVLSSARRYFQLSNYVLEFIKKTRMTAIENLPEFLADDVNGLKTNNSANKFSTCSILGVFIASIIIFVRLIGLLQ